MRKYINYLSIALASVVSLGVISCSQDQLPRENNPAIIGGYTVPLKFNWLTDSGIDINNRKLKALMAVAQQNPNNQLVIFYGKNCKNLSKQINQVLQTKNFQTAMILNTDPLRPDITYIYINFAPVAESEVDYSVSEKDAQAVLIKDNVY